MQCAKCGTMLDSHHQSHICKGEYKSGFQVSQEIDPLGYCLRCGQKTCECGSDGNLSYESAKKKLEYGTHHNDVQYTIRDLMKEAFGKDHTDDAQKEMLARLALKAKDSRQDAINFLKKNYQNMKSGKMLDFD